MLAALLLPLAQLTCQWIPAPPAPPRAVQGAIDLAFDWLVRHQDEDGRWSASLFVRHDPKGAPCTGPGKPDQDFLVSSFVLTAAVSNGSTLRSGPLQPMVQRATKWVIAQQDARGFLGPPEPDNAVCAHAIATYALGLAAGSGDPAVVAAAQRARACLFSLRLPGSGWPHAVSGTALDGEATLWAGFAALAAPGMVFQPREFQLLPNLLATDPRLPPAAVLAARSFVGPEPTAAECTVLTDHPPRWPDARHDADFLAWYLGTVACERMRGTAWTNWRDPLLAASLAHQRTDGSFAGSWDPVDVRGKEGGRVFATAMQLHCLLIARRGM